MELKPDQAHQHNCRCKLFCLQHKCAVSLDVTPKVHKKPYRPFSQRETASRMHLSSLAHLSTPIQVGNTQCREMSYPKTKEVEIRKRAAIIKWSTPFNVEMFGLRRKRGRKNKKQNLRSNIEGRTSLDDVLAKLVFSFFSGVGFRDKLISQGSIL